MSVNETSPVSNFLDFVTQSIPASQQFRLYPDADPILFTSGTRFSTNQTDQLTAYMSQQPGENKKGAHGYLAEPLFMVGVSPRLRAQGFDLVRAPKPLEHGNLQNPVDLLLTDYQQAVPTIYAGIQMKSGESPLYVTPDFGWNDRIKSPSMLVTLSNWRADLRQQKDVGVKQWSDKFVVPSLHRSGKVPMLDEFGDYGYNQIMENLKSYVAYVFDQIDDNTEDYWLDYSKVLPTEQEDIDTLIFKLRKLSALFAN